MTWWGEEKSWGDDQASCVRKTKEDNINLNNKTFSSTVSSIDPVRQKRVTESPKETVETTENLRDRAVPFIMSISA